MQETHKKVTGQTHHTDVAAQIALSFVIMLMMHRLNSNQSWPSIAMHCLCLTVSLPCIVLYRILAIERQFLICAKKFLHYMFQHCMTRGQVREGPKAGQLKNQEEGDGGHSMQETTITTSQTHQTENINGEQRQQDNSRHLPVFSTPCSLHYGMQHIFVVSTFCNTGTPYMSNTCIALSMQNSQ